VKIYEIRDPIYGFIQLNEWEREIVNHPVFQRLRRIRQLAFTDMVYPSAVYSRFEHSLGVMHLATLMYDLLISKERNVEILKSELSYNKAGLERHKQLIRIAALLHDVGHTPLSHAGEKLMPYTETKRKYRHEDYTAEIIRENLREVIEEHPENRNNYKISAEEVASLIEGNERVFDESIFWRTLISSQLDADRGDYLLRDSVHIGVKYGIYDYNRLINTISLGIEPEENKPVLGVEKGGWHVAEELILARYLMFTQVYFHKTRRAYDYHLNRVLESFLPSGTFPLPKRVDEFLEWDDWKVFQLVKENAAVNKDCEAILNRRHIRNIYETSERPDVADLKKLEKAKVVLNDLMTFEDKSVKLWYNLGGEEGSMEIFVTDGEKIKPLSSYSQIVKNIGEIKQIRIYTDYENRERAEKLLRDEQLL
jgi:HD superfamily phosphohydrolase